MKVALLLLTLIAVGGLAWVRLAPSDPVRWHVAPGPSPENALKEAADGARTSVFLPATAPEAALARLDAIAMVSPRTRRLAGKPEEGMITWITRSPVFGFPDYTTAAARADGAGARIDLHARQRFGRRDFGVNAARLRDWLARLSP